MIKKAVVQIGTTPSVVSGKPSTRVDSRGEPLAKGEKVAAVKVTPGK